MKPKSFIKAFGSILITSILTVGIIYAAGRVTTLADTTVVGSQITPESVNTVNLKLNTVGATTDGGGACYYTDSTSCMSSYSKVSGAYSPRNWGTHNICYPSL